MLESRSALARTVDRWTSSIPWLHLIGRDHLGDDDVVQSGWRTHSWMNLPFIVDETAPVSTKQVTDLLEASGIETRPVIAGNIVHHPAMEAVSYRRAARLDVADDVFANAFMIGCLPTATPDQLAVLERGLKQLETL